MNTLYISVLFLIIRKSALCAAAIVLSLVVLPFRFGVGVAMIFAVAEIVVHTMRLVWIYPMVAYIISFVLSMFLPPPLDLVITKALAGVGVVGFVVWALWLLVKLWRNNQTGMAARDA